MEHDELVEMRVSEALADRPADVCELAIQVRRFVAKQAKGCSELLYKTYAVSTVFSYTGKLGQAFIHIATYGQHVNLGFNFGAELPDPHGLLEGTGKRIRHIRIDSLKLIKDKNVRALVKAAMDRGKQLAEDAGGIQPKQFVDKTGG